MTNLKDRLNDYLDYLESGLSIIVLIGVVIYFANSLGTLTGLDWSSIDTFYFFVNYILALVVGIELAKLMITHDVFAITNLLTFVVARKMLKPDLGANEILWGVLSFSILFGLNYVGKSVIKNKQALKSNN